MPREIVSPCVVEVIVQEDGRKQEQIERRAGSEPLDDLPGALVFFVGVGSHEVEVELVGGGFGQELAAVAELLQVEELIFDQAVHGLHVALVGVGGRRDAYVLAVAEGGGEAGATAMAGGGTDELAAVVGLPDQEARLDAVAIQVALDASR